MPWGLLIASENSVAIGQWVANIVADIMQTVGQIVPAVLSLMGLVVGVALVIGLLKFVSRAFAH